MLQKVLKFAYYAVSVLVCKIMLFYSNFARNYPSTIRQGLPQVLCGTYSDPVPHSFWQWSIAIPDRLFRLQGAE